MRIISLVPSWTESLLEAGIPLVGRTRYCLFPEDRVKDVPVVGGTKSLNWERLSELKPDLLILDKEENPKEYADRAPCEYWASHIEKPADCIGALKELGEVLANSKLQQMALEWQEVLGRKPIWDHRNVPGQLFWVRKPEQEIKRIVYLIWKEPWMAVAPETFIGGMLSELGAENYLLDYPTKYPNLELTDFNTKDTLVLLSSEPFPFEKKHEEFKEFQCSSVVVDGSFYSWFGLRSLNFLKAQTALK